MLAGAVVLYDLLDLKRTTGFVAFHLHAIANRQGWAGIGKGVDVLTCRQSLRSTGLSYTSNNDSPVVNDKVGDPKSRDRTNAHYGAHNQTLMDVAYSKTGVGFSGSRAHGKESQENYMRESCRCNHRAP